MATSITENLMLVVFLIMLSIVTSAPSAKVLSEDKPISIDDPSTCNKTVQVNTYVRLIKQAKMIDGKRPPCRVTLNSTSGNKLFIVFQKSEMAKKTKSQCSSERVDVYDGTTLSNTTLLSGTGGLCGSNITSSFKSTGQTLTVVYTTNVNQTFGFTSVLTPFRSANTCGAKEFQCYSGTSCIDLSLRCNGLPNCGDKSDEMDCSTAEPTLGPLVTNEVTNGTMTTAVTTVSEATTMNITMATDVTGTTVNASAMPFIENGTTITTASDITTMNTSMVTDVTGVTMNTSMMTDSTLNVSTITDHTGTTANVSMLTDSTGTTINSTSTVPTNSSSGTETNPSTMPATTSAPATSSSPDTGAIVGGIIGAIVFIVIVVSAVYFYKKRKSGNFNESRPLNEE